MKNNVEKSYGVALSEKQLRFLVNCIDIAQDSHSIHPDKEETDLPDPDSPTTQTVSVGFISKETSSTPTTVPVFV